MVMIITANLRPYTLNADFVRCGMELDLLEVQETYEVLRVERGCHLGIQKGYACEYVLKGL